MTRYAESVRYANYISSVKLSVENISTFKYLFTFKILEYSNTDYDFAEMLC